MVERILRRLRTVATGALAVVIVIVVGLLIVHTIPALVGASGSYVVTSGSMSPTIQTGDVIFVYGTDPSTLETGDIVAFDESAGDREIVTHRIVEVVRDENGLGFVTKGDANENADTGVVRPDQVIGVVPTPFGVPTRVPLLGHLIVFAGTREGIIVLVFVPVGLLIASELYTLGRALVASRGDADGVDRENESATAEPTEDD